MRPRPRGSIVRLAATRGGTPGGGTGLTTRARTIRVLVADDHRLMQAAIRRALAGASDFEIVAEVSSGSGVAPAVHELRPDVVLLDLRMPELDGLECLRRLRKQSPDVAVVILSSYCRQEQIDAARVAGARAYVVKTVDPVDLAEVLRTALSGSGFAVWGAPEPEPVDESAAVLSERETSVLEAVAAGLSNREIAQRLWISEQTVKFHLRNVYRKLGLSSRTEASRYAHGAGLAGTMAARSG